MSTICPKIVSNFPIWNAYNHLLLFSQCENGFFSQNFDFFIEVQKNTRKPIFRTEILCVRVSCWTWPLWNQDKKYWGSTCKIVSRWCGNGRYSEQTNVFCSFHLFEESFTFVTCQNYHTKCSNIWVNQPYRWAKASKMQVTLFFH